jgi:restriction endonuclease S subunit
MRRYKIPPKLNPNNVFLVNNSEMESRLDPHFYKPEFRILQNNLESKPNSKLGNLIFYSNESWNQKDFFDDLFPYIEISSINTTSGEIKNVNYISKSEAPSRAKKIVRENDIIVSTTRPNRGAIAFIEKEYDLHIASTGFSVLRNLKTDSISKEYLYLILHQATSLKQMEQRCSGGNYPAITEDELRKIIIPTLDEKSRQIIIDTLQEAFKLKQQKEQKAKELLNSIDEYLLNELGIKIPAKDNSLPNRIFTTTFKKVSGNRIDPKIYSKHSQALIASIDKSKYPATALKNLIIHTVAGDWGIDENIIDEDYEKCLVIRATEFDNNFNLDLVNNRLKYRQIRKEKLAQLDIQANDLLIEKSGGSPDQPVGRIAIITKEILSEHKICYSNFVHKIRIDEIKILPEYLFCFLKTIHNIKITDIMQSQTSGIRNLIMHEYFNQSIVIPNDLNVQKHISDKANKMRTDAKILFEEANEELEKARQQVEKIILEEE